MQLFKAQAFAFGTIIDVESIANGWATIYYSGKKAYVSADYIAEDAAGGKAKQSDNAVKGLSIQAAIVRKNWNSDGSDKVLDCGQFELDSVDANGPPAVITIKGTSLPFRSRIRQTQKNKAWEAYNLSKIAAEMASLNGMTCMFESANDPYYARVEQISMSDIAFLSKLCHDAGISLKVTNKIMVLFDQAAYEAKPEVVTITRGAELIPNISSCQVQLIKNIPAAASAI